MTKTKDLLLIYETLLGLMNGLSNVDHDWGALLKEIEDRMKQLRRR